MAVSDCLIRPRESFLHPPGSIFGDHGYTQYPPRIGHTLPGSVLLRPDQYFQIIAVSGRTIHPRGSVLHPSGSIFGDHGHTIYPRRSVLPRQNRYFPIMAVSGLTIRPRGSALHCSYHFFCDHGHTIHPRGSFLHQFQAHLVQCPN